MNDLGKDGLLDSPVLSFDQISCSLEDVKVGEVHLLVFDQALDVAIDFEVQSSVCDLPSQKLGT